MGSKSYVKSVLLSYASALAVGGGVALWYYYLKPLLFGSKDPQVDGNSAGCLEARGAEDEDLDAGELEEEDEFSADFLFYRYFVEWRELRGPDELINQWLKEDQNSSKLPSRDPSRWKDLLCDAVKRVRDRGDLLLASESVNEATQEIELMPPGLRMQAALSFAKQTEGWIHCRMELLGSAQKLLLDSIHTWNEGLGNTHAIFPVLLMNLARLCLSMDKFDFTEELSRRAFFLAQGSGKVREKVESLFLLSAGLEKQNMLESAFQVLLCAREIARQRKATLQTQTPSEGRMEYRCVYDPEYLVTEVDYDFPQSAAEEAVAFEIAAVLFKQGRKQEADSFDQLWIPSLYAQVEFAMDGDVRMAQYIQRVAQLREEDGNMDHESSVLNISLILLSPHSHAQSRSQDDVEDVGDEILNRYLAPLFLRKADIMRKQGDLKGAKKELYQGIHLLRGSGNRIRDLQSQARKAMAAGSREEAYHHRKSLQWVSQGALLQSCFCASLARIFMESSQMGEAEDSIERGVRFAVEVATISFTVGESKLTEEAEAMELRLLGLRQQIMAVDPSLGNTQEVNLRVEELSERLGLSVQIE